MLILEKNELKFRIALVFRNQQMLQFRLQVHPRIANPQISSPGIANPGRPLI